jgi:hypothetical protein
MLAFMGFGLQVAGASEEPPPTVVTGSASSITQTEATLNATVNPNGSTVTECKFEYGTSEFMLGSSAPCESLPGAGTGPVSVSARVGGLMRDGMTYFFRISATNAGGSSTGSLAMFHTAYAPPTAVTEAATLVGQKTATLHGKVNPEGSLVQECVFEYGTSEAYGSSVPCEPPPGTGSMVKAVSAKVTGLVGNTHYHFRVSARNRGGTTQGSDQTFTTLLSHWYKSNVLLAQGARATFVAWGTLTLTSSNGAGVVCHTAAAGYVENPMGGGPGVDQIEPFAAFRCESHKFCPSGAATELIGERLPWPAVLEEIEGLLIRTPTTGIRLSIDCIVGGNAEVAAKFITNPLSACCATQAPRFWAGVSASNPSFLEYAAGSGELEEEGSAEAVKATTEGEVKMFGFANQELLVAKSP